MSANPHQRAKQLLAQALVEGIDRADQSWLDAHLRECEECSREALRTQELVRSFRSLPVAVPRDLAARTQLRVRLRLQESARTSSSNAFLWVITAASWALGILSAPYVWRIFAWVGSELNLPKLVLEFGFVLWWMVPALVAAGVVLYHRSTGPARSL